jgi:hypothetical protein
MVFDMKLTNLIQRIIFAFSIVTLAAFGAFAQSAPDAKHLTALLNEFLAGAAGNDAAVHDRFWADDLIYTRSAGIRMGKAELMKNVRSAPSLKAGDTRTTYAADDIRIQQYGNAAVLAFRLIAKTERSDGVTTNSEFLNTGMLVKRKGKWQVVAWQSTAVPKTANSIPKE